MSGRPSELRGGERLRVSYILAAIAEKSRGQDRISGPSWAQPQRRAKRGREQIRRFFEGRRESISAMIRERKALALVREKASVKDA